MSETTSFHTEQPVYSPAERERIYHRNFLFFASDFILFSIAMSLIGSTTVIPDFVRHLTDSEILIGLSSQLFEIGWLLPQLLIARRLERVANKKWWFVGPNIPVRPIFLVLGITIVILGKDRRHAILAAFLFFYVLAALGDGLVGVPWLDLIGSSLDNKRRARLFGLGTASVGIAMLGLSRVVGLILSDKGPDFPNNYALLFGLSGSIIFFTIIPTLFIKELPGGKARETLPPMREYLGSLVGVLHQDGPFRAMIGARVLAMLFTLANPFYIGFATEQLDMSSDVAVSNLLLMQTLGSVCGSLLFSWLGEHRSLQFIRLALMMGILQPLLALFASAIGPAPLYGAFATAGLLQGTLGISFLNWLLSYTTPEQRPAYTGMFNTASAVSLFTAPLVGGAIVQTLGYEIVFAAALLIILVALLVTVRYVSDPQDSHQPA